MEYPRSLTVLVLCIGVVAVGAAAAGVGDPGQDQQVGQPETGDTVGQGSAVMGSGAGGSGQSASPWAVPPWLVDAVVFMLIPGLTIVAALGAAVLVWREGWGALLGILVQARDVAIGIALYVALMGVLFWLAYDLSDQRSTVAPAGPAPASGGPADPGTVTEVGQSTPPLLAIAIVLALGVGAIFVLRAVQRMGTNEDETAETGHHEDLESVPDPDRTAPGSTHPREVDADNAVYRAWQTLVRRTGYRADRTRTPGEVATAAIEQGLDRDAVGTLTGVFAEVRYGDRPVTDERTRRVESALSRIESSGGED